MAHTYDSKSEQRDREHNEDRGWAGTLHLADGTAVEAAIVADGVGGQPYGEEVAQATVDAFREAVRGATIADLRDEARSEIWGERWQRQLESRVQSAYPGGFSTLCAAVWTGREAVAFSVGDSPMFLVTKGSVSRLFEAHTQAEEQLRNGVPEEEIAPAAYSRLVRAVGRRHPEGRPLADFRWMALREPGWLLLGSDGVFNHIGGSELRRAVETAQAGGAAEIAREVLSISLANGRRKGGRLDNATLSLLGIHQKAPTGLPLLKQIAAGSFRRRKSCLGRGLLYAALAASLVVLGVLVAKKARHGEPATPSPAPAAPEAPAQPDQTTEEVTAVAEAPAGTAAEGIKRFRFVLLPLGKSDKNNEIYFFLKGKKKFKLALEGEPWLMDGELDENCEIYEFAETNRILRICVDDKWYKFDTNEPSDERDVCNLIMRNESSQATSDSSVFATDHATSTTASELLATDAGELSALAQPGDKTNAQSGQPPSGAKAAPSATPPPADSGTKVVAAQTNAVAVQTNAAAKPSPAVAPPANGAKSAEEDPEDTSENGAAVFPDDGISPEESGGGTSDTAPPPNVLVAPRNGNSYSNRQPRQQGAKEKPYSGSRAPISNGQRQDAGTAE